MQWCILVHFGAAMVQIGASWCIMVQSWCGHGAVMVQPWCSGQKHHEYRAPGVQKWYRGRWDDGVALADHVKGSWKPRGGSGMHANVNDVIIFTQLWCNQNKRGFPLDTKGWHAIVWQVGKVKHMCTYPRGMSVFTQTAKVDGNDTKVRNSGNIMTIETGLGAKDAQHPDGQAHVFVVGHVSDKMQKNSLFCFFV